MTDSNDPAQRSSEDNTHSEVAGSASDMVQARDVHGGVHFHGPNKVPWTVPPRQLPADVRGFVNRLADLGQLDKVLVGDPQQPLTVRLSVIAGTAGVGKTSLAVHWAHRIREHFPDGQLYVNLRGYDPGPPVEPAQALDHFLRALDVPSNAIPANLDAKASMFRSLLADRRILIVLDNVATAAQVRPLLPGTAGCLTLVTSRSRLSGLVFRDGAHRLTLGMLTEPEAVNLLRTVIADYRVENDGSQLTELARLCARLPLALRIAAERAARRPSAPLEELIQDLRNESGLWDALSADDDEEADAVRTVFAWSYRALTEESAHFFRLLGLHPGPDFSTSAAAALTATDIGQARHMLDVLVGAHLLEYNPPDRYQFHDLLRVYATDQARQEESDDSRSATLHRSVIWYLYVADSLQSTMSPLSPRLPLDLHATHITPLRLTDLTEANRCYMAERANLVAATRAAADAGLNQIAWQLAAILHHIYRNINQFEDWYITTRTGLDAARRLGHRGAEAELLESLATVSVQTRDFTGGVERYGSSLTIRRELGDQKGEAAVLNGLGLLHLRRRALGKALASFEASLHIAQELDDIYWQTVVQGNLCTTYYHMGNLAGALDLGLRALAVYEQLGDQLGEGNSLHSLSRINREMGRLDSALQMASRTISIAREHDNAMWEGYWLIELGNVQREIGQPAEALTSYQRAASLQRKIGDRSREAQALDGTGLAYRYLERYKESADFHRLAITAHRDLDDHWLLAIALDNLATVLHIVGDDEEASQYWREALSGLDKFDDPRAVLFRRRINQTLNTD